MEKIKSKFLALFLFIISMLVFFDIYGDARKDGINWHLALEISIGLISAGIFIYLLKSINQTRVELKDRIRDFNLLKQQSDQYKKETEKHIRGLSLAIDKQLDQWKLTKAEKEVAYLLLKGLSTKEAAEVRSTSEKTVRVQAQSIYDKSGLASRAELSAFFLEDLLDHSDQHSSVHKNSSEQTKVQTNKMD